MAFPKHSLPRSTRIAAAILDQAAGKACTPSDAAKLFGLSNPGGTFAVEVASSLKYGMLERPESGQIQPTTLARKILRPQNPNDPVEGYREALLLAPVVSDVYQHYRGENIPDDQFFRNALAEKFGISADDFAEFKQVFLESLETAQLLAVHGDKTRIIDITSGAPDAAPRRSCAGVGDSRSGLRPRPIVANFKYLSGFEFILLPSRVHAPLIFTPVCPLVIKYYC